MKTKKVDIDIDTIGGFGSLTVIEEKSLSDYFLKKKTIKKNVEKKKLST